MKTETTIEKQFKEDCRVVGMDTEYPGHQEKIKWIIYSDLSENEISAKYGEIIEQYMPCMFLSMEFYAPVRDYHSNERKHRMHLEKIVDPYSYVDGQGERFHPELVYEPLCFMDYYDLEKAIDMLPEKQRKRIIQRYYMDMTVKEIAGYEKASEAAVYRSLIKAIGFIRNKLMEN